MVIIWLPSIFLTILGIKPTNLLDIFLLIIYGIVIYTFIYLLRLADLEFTSSIWGYEWKNNIKPGDQIKGFSNVDWYNTLKKRLSLFVLITIPLYVSKIVYNNIYSIDIVSNIDKITKNLNIYNNFNYIVKFIIILIIILTIIITIISSDFLTSMGVHSKIFWNKLITEKIHIIIVYVICGSSIIYLITNWLYSFIINYYNSIKNVAKIV